MTLLERDERMREEGRKEGREEGRKEGLEEGRKEALRESAHADATEDLATRLQDKLSLLQAELDALRKK